MLALIEEMDASILYWLQAQFKEAPPALLAEDATPWQEMRKRFRKLAKQWIKRFDEAAPKIAEAYLKGSFKTTNSAMRMALKDAGLAVKFEMTRGMRDAFNASLAENIGLIKSIPEQYLQKVEGVVARGYASGRDLQAIIKGLRRLYPITQNRAILIARDQSNKANAVVTKARQLELGINKAQWKHSHGGKVPRPDHVAADGRIYDVAKGCLISGERIWPGEKINCRCTSRSILPTGLIGAKFNA
jgi:SPP1 gp7 family putative phage head morphogenesis protein